MKKTLSIISVVLSLGLFASCDLLKLDNFDGPDAQVTGKFLDAKTGEMMGIECPTVSEWSWSTWSMQTNAVGGMIVNEQGWKNLDGTQVTSDQRWFVRYDGKYTNNRVFAADYKLSTKDMPCYQPENADFTLKKGANTVDFEVTPFCRIVDEHIVYDATAGKLIATFKVELGDRTKANSINAIAFCANTQKFVGCTYFNLAKDDAGAKKPTGWNPGPVATEGQTLTLEINLNEPKNADLFKYEQDRYFRIAALAAGNGYNGNNYYNFSKTWRISADYKTIEPAVWD